MLKHERRFLASLIDLFIVLTITLVINIFIPNGIFMRRYLFGLIYFLVGFIYMFLCLVISKNRTIGLYALSLKLLHKDWKNPTMKAIIIRGLVAGVPVLYLINILYMLINKSEITLFDELSDSFVVNTGDNYSVDKTNNSH